MKWRRITRDIIRSDCRRYYICRIVFAGDEMFEAIYKGPTGLSTIQIGHIVLDPNTARQQCVDHAAKLTAA